MLIELNSTQNSNFVNKQPKIPNLAETPASLYPINI